MASIRDIQAPIKERYTRDPSSAAVTLRVHGGRGPLDDPLHCEVGPDGSDVTWSSGAHPAVGGVGDVPCSGDLLLGALVACQEITIRMVAANMRIAIESLDISAEADWDPRGTLAMGDHPVGLTAIRCRAVVRVPADVDAQRAERLLRSAEKYCVVLDTLRSSLPVEAELTVTGVDPGSTGGSAIT